MEALFDSIRIALTDGSSGDERTRGVIACRALADILDGPTLSDIATTSDNTEPVATTPATPAAALEPAIPAAMMLAPLGTTGAVASNPFAGLSADQILDAAIARLHRALGDKSPPEPAGPPFRVTLVTVPRIR